MHSSDTGLGPRGVLPVQVVDRVAPVVLDVPAERREAHAHVQPGELHAAYVSGDVSKNRLFHHWHVVQVPAAVQVFLKTQKQKRETDVSC